MLMRLSAALKLEVLLIHNPTQMEMCLVIEEKNVQKARIILSAFAYPLAKFISFSFVGLGLCLNQLCRETILSYYE